MKNLIKIIAIVLVVTIMIKDLPLQSYAIDYYTDGEEDELFDDSDTDDDYDDIPEGCRACGGPYPDCMDSCPLFDDQVSSVNRDDYYNRDYSLTY